MESIQSFTRFADLFAGSFGRNASTTSAIRDTLAMLPNDPMRQEVAVAAEWLLAVLENCSTSARNGRAKDLAEKHEKSKGRHELLNRLLPPTRQVLRKSIATAYLNDQLLGDGSLGQYQAFLMAQTKRQVAASAAQQQMQA